MQPSTMVNPRIISSCSRLSRFFCTAREPGRTRLLCASNLERTWPSNCLSTKVSVNKAQCTAGTKSLKHVGNNTCVHTHDKWSQKSSTHWDTARRTGIQQVLNFSDNDGKHAYVPWRLKFYVLTSTSSVTFSRKKNRRLWPPILTNASMPKGRKCRRDGRCL